MDGRPGPSAGGGGRSGTDGDNRGADSCIAGTVSGDITGGVDGDVDGCGQPGPASVPCRLAAAAADRTASFTSAVSWPAAGAVLVAAAEPVAAAAELVVARDTATCPTDTWAASNRQDDDVAALPERV